MARTFLEKSLGQSLLGEKVIRRREKKRKEKKTTNLVATSFATQPVCNAARAPHALRSDQFTMMSQFTNLNLSIG
jgi:hypothetical protein